MHSLYVSLTHTHTYNTHTHSLFVVADTFYAVELN